MLTAVLLGGGNDAGLAFARRTAPTPASTATTLLSSMTGAALGLAVMPPLLYLSSALTHESAPLPTLALLALFGMLLTGPSGLCWRLGNLLVKNLAVNIPQYLLPIFSLTWLAAAGLITVQSPAMLLPGMALVLTANLLISLTHRPR